MLKLYDYFRSSACYRVRIALNLKKLDYETIPVHLINNNGEQFSETYQKINPQSLVPSLQDDSKIITQSLAIIEYLEENYPKPAIFPSTSFEKAQVRSFALGIAADTHPLNNLRVLKYLSEELKITDVDKMKWYQHWVAKGLGALEKKLANHQPDKFCFGNQPTIADIFLVPQIYNAKRFSCDLSQYPILMNIYHHCQQMPAFIDAEPKETL